MGLFAIRRLNPESIRLDRGVLLLGRRGSGKSTLLTALMYYLADKLDVGVAMSPTHDSVEMFLQFLPPVWVYDEYREDVVKSIIEAQKTLLARAKPKARWVFILTDDCMFDSKIMKTKTMRDLYMNGRHYNIFFIHIAQYLVDIPTWARANTDYIFCLDEPSRKRRLKVYEEFGGMFESYEEFSKVYTFCTAEHRCMVIDTTGGTGDPETCVYWWRAEPPIPPYRLGSDHYWRMHYSWGKLAMKDASHDNRIADTVANLRDPAAEVMPEAPVPGGRPKAKAKTAKGGGQAKAKSKTRAKARARGKSWASVEGSGSDEEGIVFAGGHRKTPMKSKTGFRARRATGFPAKVRKPKSASSRRRDTAMSFEMPQAPSGRRKPSSSGG